MFFFCAISKIIFNWNWILIRIFKKNWIRNLHEFFNHTVLGTRRAINKFKWNFKFQIYLWFESDFISIFPLIDDSFLNKLFFWISSQIVKLYSKKIISSSLKFDERILVLLESSTHLKKYLVLNFFLSINCDFRTLKSKLKD